MSAVRKKKNYRHTSTFYRKLKQQLDETNRNRNSCLQYKITKKSNFIIEKPTCKQIIETHVIDTAECLAGPNEFNLSMQNSVEDECLIIPEVDINDYEEENKVTSQIDLLQQLTEWSLKHRLTHSSVNDLLQILNASGMKLPSDSRTLLSTPKSVNIIAMGNGEYWYNGITNCLLTTFSKIREDVKLSLVFNVDGLPPFRNAPTEFWPILMKIENMQHLKPMVVSIYCGETKPSLEEFFTPFVNELNNILENGIYLNGYKIEVKLRYFVCDTPARSFIKGTVGFNAAHGCIKCTVIGEYDKGGRHMSYPRINCDLRTDESFRQKLDEDHHKENSPLLKLPIDMIKDVIIADSLHLLDLGLTRKCLYGWVNGSYNFRTKLSGQQINLISGMLEDCNNRRPTEIHRAIRNLKCLKFWKGAEFRTFLLYVGSVVLRDFLSAEAYHNFLTLSCATTIISCKTYLVHIHVAEQLLKDYIQQFINIYGEDSISSNVHNLCHIINDVKNFGNLTEISSYPFENFLGQLKSLIRTGNRPLAQIAKRVIELSKLNCATNIKPQEVQPFVKNENMGMRHQLPSCTKIFERIYFPNKFLLSNKIKDKWFMTKTNDIVSMINATYYQENIFIYGAAVKTKTDFFELPLKSSKLNIYKSDGKQTSPKLYSLSEIKCKLISLQYKNDFVFMPLVHTLDM